MRTNNIFWWGLYFFCAIWLQAVIPGLDALVPGLIVSLQERNFRQIFAIFGLCTLIQEGVGTLDFGASLLWYSTVVFIFFLGRWLFETENLVFIFMLSACIGVSHYAIVRAMCALQFIPVNEPLLLDESSLQGLLTPVLWKIASLTRRWVVLHENTA